jgi:hypothetical protein
MATRDSLVRWLVDQSVGDRAGPRNARRRARPRGAAGNTHKDVEFAVDDSRGEEHIFKTFEEAIAFAGRMALTSTVRIELDVLVYSREGAMWWGGIDGAQDYDEDPEASVFDRLHVKVTSQGRVP